MFLSAKGFKKEDLVFVAEEIGVTLPPKVTIADLKGIILSSKEYLQDQQFVTDILVTTIAERKRKEEKECEEKKRQYELEMARIQAETMVLEANQLTTAPEVAGAKKKFNLPKLEFRQFSGDIKDWLPFWSQFEHIHKDDEIAPENKFQYLIQATVSGSRAREVVESFPPTGANYAKAVESLKARFGREDLLVEVYVRELLKLIISVQKNEKFPMTSLYDKLESYLRALETLNVTTDKYASILYPMVESCFHEEFLKAWNRCPTSSSSADAKERLDNLMAFLKLEVEGEERIKLAMTGFGLGDCGSSQTFKKRQWSHKHNKIPTAANLLTTPLKEANKSCVFCMGKHSSSDCFSAQKMSLSDRQCILKEKNCCFACLNPGHPIRKCRVFIKCIICGKKHVPLMCETLNAQKHKSIETSEEKVANSEINLSNTSVSPKVFLQTLKVKLISPKKEIYVRLVLDSGSQRSYILKNLAEEMGYFPVRKETLIHSLFGGVKSEEYNHTCYRIKLRNIENNLTCNFEALDQMNICGDIAPINPGPWLKELERMEISLTDVGEKSQPVQVLIGADVLGKLLTGQRKVLSSGLVALETLLGWTLFGKVPEGEPNSSNAMLVTSLFIKEADISELWKLDSIGIKDPIESLSKKEAELLTQEHFLKTVTYTDEKRYEVHLPWLENCAPLPDNLELAKRRLDSTTKKLLFDNLYDGYERILLQWQDDGIIEEVPAAEIDLSGNYLPHRPVLKESSSTPIRPVFDASARIKGHPSLNQSLHSGPNLIELIPDILLRFREKKIGVTADIKKAFLQISICKKDRNFLRFLWWKNKDCKEYKVFRHARVVFGVRSSPFLLEAVLKHHLEKNAGVDTFVNEYLLKGFYVDNLLTSVHNEEHLKRIINVSNDVLKSGGFELRDWEYSMPKHEDSKDTDLLGLHWNKYEDVFSLNLKWLKGFSLQSITKRTMLSATQKVFDPLGFITPVMLCPKIMLQKTWKMSLDWDEVITGALREEFLQWFNELEALHEVRVPRWIHVTSNMLENCSIHIFCDASKDVYAAVVYLVHKGEDKNVCLLTSRSRIAPLKVATIPRLELLAALVGARLAKSVVDALGWTTVKCYYWSDSTTVLTWITKDENWSVFVKNRVDEIRRISQISSWRHVPGDINPADLPSRGCKADHLVKTRWWEGPRWLNTFQDDWLSPEFVVDEDEVLKEQKKNTVSSLVSFKQDTYVGWYYQRFSKYESIVRLMCWILRFIKNKKCSKLAIGEIVLIGSDNTRRSNWPLGKVIELIPGKDGICRLARLQTARGEVLRPVQRIYPLEVSGNDAQFATATIVREKKAYHLTDTKENQPICSKKSAVQPQKAHQQTRYGRIIKIPEKLDL